jgi:hypothetical protein
MAEGGEFDSVKNDIAVEDEVFRILCKRKNAKTAIQEIVFITDCRSKCHHKDQHSAIGYRGN